MSISQARARQIIKEEVARALRTRRLSEMGGMHGHMEDAAYEGAYEGDVYEFDETSLDDGYSMDEMGMMDDEGMLEYDMEEGQHDNDMGGQHDNDLGAGDDALMESLRRRLLGARRRR